MADQSSTPVTLSEAAAMVEVRRVFKVLSVLLDYPGEHLVEAREDLGGVVNNLLNRIAREKCGDFLAYLDSTPLIQLQEEYTRLFDFNPGTCLNMTFHKCGESKARGFALADLAQIYRDSGYEPATGELPDYLPLMLEFLSVCDPDTCRKLLTRYDAQIFELTGRLQEKASTYAAPLEALSSIAAEFAGKGD